MKFAIAITCLLFVFLGKAQKSNNEILKGNEAYKKGDFKNAETEYDNALKVDGKNATALFNKGNALQKQGKLDEAAKQYESTAENSTNLLVQSKALYNKGVAEAKQKQWQQAVGSFKQALRLQPTDIEARDNLQKAMNEIKKQQEKNPQDNKKDDKKNSDDRPKEKKQEPKMNKQQMEKELNKLRNEEKRLQHDLQKQKIRPSSVDKDW